MRDVDLRAVSDFTASEQSDAGVLCGPDLVAQTIMVEASGKSGTSPTVDIKIQESATSGGTFYDLTAFPQINDAGQWFVTVKGSLPYKRAYCTLGGSNTPKILGLHICLVPAGRHTNW